MSSGSRFLDEGYKVGQRYAVEVPSFTAGSGADNVKTNGLTLDRFDGLPNQCFGSSRLGLAYRATLAAAATLTLTVERQESDDGTTWGTATAVYPATVVATGPGGGGTVRGCLNLRESYETSAQYVRYNVTADLSAVGTDTASVHGVAAMVGASVLPVA